MKFILGSGLVGLLGRDILGDDWTLIPIGRSRFYSFTPPLADNFVITNEIIDEYMSAHSVMPKLYRIAFSYGGQILFQPTIALSNYLSKVYGDDVPPHAEIYIKDNMEFFADGNCTLLYEKLHKKYKEEIAKNNNKYGNILKIVDHSIHTSGGIFDYDEITATVPLDILFRYMGVEWDLPAKNEHYYHIRTDCLDFEGATHILVVDPEIEFHKVTMLDPRNFIFHSCKPIEHPGQYFMQHMKRFDLIAETSVANAICCGPIPPTGMTDDVDIVRAGSAVWDDCLGIGAVIMRFIKMGK